MKFEEALKLMREGKKITCDRVGDGSYIWMSDGLIYKCNSNDLFHSVFGLSANTILSDDWGIYEETKKYLTFQEAIEEMKKGKLVTLSEWPMCIHIVDGDFRMFNDTNSLNVNFTYTHTQRNDWYVVEWDD